MSEPSDREIQWRDYELGANMYKFYIEQAVKINVFYFGIAGAIVSYVLAHSDIKYVRLGLLLPFIISGFLAVGFGAFVGPAKWLDKDTERLANKLKLMPNDFSPLVYILIGFAVLQLFCTAAIGYLMYTLQTSAP
jgi:hypothetical protein